MSVGTLRTVNQAAVKRADSEARERVRAMKERIRVAIAGADIKAREQVRALVEVLSEVTR